MVSLAMMALSQNAIQLFIARIIDGATGGNVSIAQAIISDSAEGEERAKAFGMLGASFGIGFVKLLFASFIIARASFVLIAFSLKLFISDLLTKILGCVLEILLSSFSIETVGKIRVEVLISKESNAFQFPSLHLYCQYHLPAANGWCGL